MTLGIASVRYGSINLYYFESHDCWLSVLIVANKWFLHFPTTRKIVEILTRSASGGITLAQLFRPLESHVALSVCINAICIHTSIPAKTMRWKVPIYTSTSFTYFRCIESSQYPITGILIDCQQLYLPPSIQISLSLFKTLYTKRTRPDPK